MTVPLLLLCSCVLYAESGSALTFRPFFRHEELVPSPDHTLQEDISTIGTGPAFYLLSFGFVQSGRYSRWCEPSGSACVENFTDVPTRVTELLLHSSEARYTRQIYSHISVGLLTRSKTHYLFLYASIMLQANDIEVHVTRGRWNEDRWGAPPPSTPPGEP